MSSAISVETKPIPMRIEARRKFLEGLSSASPISSSPPPPPSPSLLSMSNMDKSPPVVSYSKKSTQESKEYYKSDTLEASREIRTTEQESYERGSPKFFHHHHQKSLLDRSSSDVDVVDSAPTTRFINYSSSPSVNSDRFSKTTTTSRLHGSNPSIVTEQFQQRQHPDGTLTSSSGYGRSYFSNNSNRSSPTPPVVTKNGGPTEKIEYNIRIEKSPDILRGSEDASSVSPGQDRRKEDASVEVVELQLNKELEYEPHSGAGPDARRYPPLEPQLLVQSEFNKGNKTSYDFAPVVESKKERKARKKREAKQQEQNVQKKSFGDAFFDAFVFCGDCLTCYGKGD